MKKSAIVVLGLMVSGFSFVFADDQAASPAATPPSQAAPAATPEGAPAATPAAPANVKVEKAAVGTAVENKEITGEAAEFPSTTEKVYCWSKVTTDQTPTSIKHVWSADGKKEAEVALDVKYPSTRTWSSKVVWPGAWKVDVTDDQGKVLATKEFTVSKEAAQAAPPAAAPAATAPPAAAPPPQVGQ